MTAPSWVFDTNILISGMISRDGPPGRLLDLITSGDLRMTLDDRIFGEYHSVLARSKFHITLSERETLISTILEQDFVTVPRLNITLPDPSDLPFLEAAQHATDKILVTGNPRHFPRHLCGEIQVLSPRDAWDKFP